VGREAKRPNLAGFPAIPVVYLAARHPRMCRLSDSASPRGGSCCQHPARIPDSGVSDEVVRLVSGAAH
jgi:hypothetical protein